MLDMRKFSREYRLQSDSMSEITTDFDMSVLGLSRIVKFQGRKLKSGPMLNALALWFAELPANEQEALGRAAVERLERMLSEGDDQAEASAPTPERAPKHGQSVPTSPRRKNQAG